ncbi:pantoate--beta-alanine ligase [Ferrimonas marina]|uniref:Pantothenate synthetase n=1 Tax=Ferrimonas marina TaxID=299255 RepID=A0A1M5ZEW3_9GAMM|nr:pantoate--beta-alanine ligase [Ferrimonas marina]SHI22724.1 pantoate--beta-alanine ligase [Ferrimonas marina]
MQTISDVNRLRQKIRQWRQEGLRVAFVPTMGNLHDGHIELVTQAKGRADKVVSSIFVNPMQFGAGEDLDSYPRTLEADQKRLVAAGCDLLFTPDTQLLYPSGLGEQTFVEVPGLSDLHCGASRPGHFRGVTTIVTKLFNLVQPDLACFGQKDYQQLAIIRAMVRDLNLPVEIVGIATVREADGLAMSSRNGYLTELERAIAPELKKTLDLTATALDEMGLEHRETLEQQAQQRLAERGFEPDFFRICHATTLQPATPGDQELVILAAAYLGKARLIDNLTLTLSS